MSGDVVPSFVQPRKRCVEAFLDGRTEAIPPPIALASNSDVNTTAGWIGLENAPDHYKGKGMEPFNVWDEYWLDPFEAHVLRYLVRADKKGSRENDLQKALHYTEEIIIRVDRGDIRYMGRHVPRVRPEFEPEEVSAAFGLTGHVGSATRLLLHWRISGNPTALYAVKRYVRRALDEPIG